MRNLLTIASLAIFGHTYAQTGPGGVGSSTTNVLWLDANYGVSHLLGAVNTWSDRSGNANHAYLPVTIPLGTPNLVSSSVNGNRSIDFDGFDDQLWVPHHSSLSLTQWHFFIVVTADLQKDYNAWLVKGDDSDENYELLSYSDGNIHTPVKWTDGTRTFPSSAGGQVTTTTFDIIEYSFSAAVGRDVYRNGTNIITDNENKTPKVNTLPLYIGNERSTLGRNINGDLAEVIAYNAPLNGTQRLVLNNSLAAKYDRTLSAGDIYLQDNSGQGNYDYDVAGIGRISSTDLQNDARGSGLVRINNPTGLGDNEYLIWGRDNGDLGTFGVTGLPTGVQGRWQRTWRVNEVNASGTAVDVGAVDMTWDLSGFAAVTTSDLRLLVDANNNNNFADDTPIGGATSVGGGLYRFASVTALTNNVRFTLGTTNVAQTPLPVELLSFTALPNGTSSVDLAWATASEHNAARFVVQRSADAENWTEVTTLEAMGNSSNVVHYEAVDRDAPAGICYYRLLQIDADGRSDTSPMVVVFVRSEENEMLAIAPNPANGIVQVVADGLTGPFSLAVVDATGRAVREIQHPAQESISIPLDPVGLSTGAYTLVLRDNGRARYGRLLIEH